MAWDMLHRQVLGGRLFEEAQEAEEGSFAGKSGRIVVGKERRG